MELLKSNVPNVTGGFYSKMKEEIQDYKFTEKDGLLASDYYGFFRNKVESFTDEIARKKFNVGTGISPFEHEKFEASMRKWLKEYTLDKFNGNTVDRETAFKKFVKEEFNLIQDKILADKADGFSDGQEVTLDGETQTPIIVKTEDIPKKRK